MKDFYFSLVENQSLLFICIYLYIRKWGIRKRAVEGFLLHSPFILLISFCFFHAVFHGADVCGKRLVCFAAMLFDDLDDGASHDGAVRSSRHVFRLIGRCNAEANGDGNVRVLPDRIGDGFDVRRDFAPDACDPMEETR